MKPHVWQILFLVATGLVSGTAGQEMEQRAILVEQATPGRGIPVLPANHLVFFRAAYELDQERIDVFLLPGGDGPGSDEFPGIWSPFGCGTSGSENEAVFVALLDTPVDVAPRILWTPLVEEYSLLCRGTLTDELWCAFLQVFRERFCFFMEAIGVAPVPPVPAILPISPER